MPRAGLLFLLGLLACRSGDGARQSAAGELQAQWSDSAGTARVVASAEAAWCARDTLLEILALRNDTAVGLALYARDSVRAEGYPVFQAALFAPWRPQASAALRVPEQTELRGFESSRGMVTVTEGGSVRVSGTFDLHLKRTAGGVGDSLQVTGQFTAVPIRPAPASCGRANKPVTQ